MVTMREVEEPQCDHEGRGGAMKHEVMISLQWLCWDIADGFLTHNLCLLERRPMPDVL